LKILRNKMTTFILHGGYTSTPNESNKRYYSEIINRTPENGRILFLYFAQEESKWKNLLENDKENMNKTGIIKKLNLEIASTDKRELLTQIQSADCLYLRGGKDDSLRRILEEINCFDELIQGKLVVGSSAGANVLSKYCWRNSKKSVEEGLGILPIKVFCHYDETKKQALEKLKAHKENLPVYTIPETEFIIIRE